MYFTHILVKVVNEFWKGKKNYRLVCNIFVKFNKNVDAEKPRDIENVSDVKEIQ